MFMLLSHTSRGVMKVPVAMESTGVMLVPVAVMGTGVMFVPMAVVGTGVVLVPAAAVGTGVMLVPVTMVGTGVVLVPVTTVGTGVMLVLAAAVGTGVTLLLASCCGLRRGRLCRRDSTRNDVLRVFSSHTSGNIQDTAPRVDSGEVTGMTVASGPAGSNPFVSMGGRPGGLCSGGTGAGNSAPSGVPWQCRGSALPFADGSEATKLQEKSGGAARHP